MWMVVSWSNFCCEMKKLFNNLSQKKVLSIFFPTTYILEQNEYYFILVNSYFCFDIFIEEKMFYLDTGCLS